jgi:hypothetical protein
LVGWALARQALPATKGDEDAKLAHTFPALPRFAIMTSGFQILDLTDGSRANAPKKMPNEPNTEPAILFQTAENKAPRLKLSPRQPANEPNVASLFPGGSAETRHPARPYPPPASQLTADSFQQCPHLAYTGIFPLFLTTGVRT